MNNTILQLLVEEIENSVDVHTQQTYQRFFREEVKYHGVKMGVVGKIASRYYREIKHLEKAEIFSLCEELLKTDFGEEAAIAFKWAFSLHKKYKPEDFRLFESWLEKYVNSWAKCDDFCNHAVGEIVEQNPGYIKDLKRWAKSDNRWMRRGAAVTMILPARKGLFLNEVFEIADILLLDEDDLVRKGYGWMLKESSRTHQEDVFDYIQRKKAVMPRVALRYAIELMPDNLRKEAMKKE